MKQIEADITEIECELQDAVNGLRRHPKFHPALEAIMPDFASITTRLQAVAARVPVAMAAATAEGVATGEANAEAALADDYAAQDTATSALEALFPAPIEANDADSLGSGAGADSLGVGNDNITAS